MKIGLYFPNKPLFISNPSGDRTIGKTIIQALEAKHHRWFEMSNFRSRWFWLKGTSILRLPLETFRVMKSLALFKPDLWITYHSYYKAPDLFGPVAVKSKPYVLIQPMFSRKRLKRAKTKIGALCNLFALNRADLLISNNLIDLESLEKIGFKKKLFYTPPGIITKYFFRNTVEAESLRKTLSIAKHRYVLLTVCRFRPGSKWQSLAFLFKSLKNLTNKIDFVLIVVGSGPLEKQVKELAKETIGEKAVFVGEVTYEALFAYYSLADLFVFPGIRESLGMVYLEAQCCGCPVVALKGPGVSQVVLDGKTGLLVEPYSPDLYGEVVAELLKNPAMREDMGKSGEHFVRESRDAAKNNAYMIDIIEKNIVGYNGIMAITRD